jgi:hypothetical protein
MRNFIFSTLFAMVLTLTGVITFAYGGQDNDAQTNKSIEQSNDPNNEFNQEPNTDNLEDTPDTGSKSNQMDDSPKL